MPKLIGVENHKVVVTDTETGEKIIQPYIMEVDKTYIMHTYTKVHDRPNKRTIYKKEDIIATYSEAAEDLGCSIVQFRKMLNGASYRAYIKDNEALHNRFSLIRHANGKWTREPYLVNIVNDNIELLNGFIKDGLNHVAGFALTVGDSKRCKKVLGKKLWKRLSNNSLTRNDIITKILLYEKSTCQNAEITEERLKELTRFLQETPSTILKRIKHYGMLQLFYAKSLTNVEKLILKFIKHMDKPLYKITEEDAFHTSHIIQDTYHMFMTLNKQFNPVWSINRILREHDKAQVDILRKSTTNRQYELVGTLPNEIKKDGFTATLCKSQRELAILGYDEKHCVAIYHNRIANGTYAVYKIMDEERLVSTLGCPITCTGTELHFSGLQNQSQHYHKMNKPVKDPLRIKFANFVLKTKVKVKVPMENKPLIRTASAAGNERGYYDIWE